MKFGLGQSVPRLEDPRLLSGAGRYTDDISLQGQVHAAFVRSPHAHATLGHIDATEACQLPGVLAVYTHADIAADGLGDLPTFAPKLLPLKRPDGEPIYVPPHPALAADKVCHVGDPVAFVVAKSEALAREAVELVAVDYDPLPANTETVAALNCAPVWADCPDNVCFEFTAGDPLKTDAALAAAHHVTHVSVPVTRLSVNAMEPRASVAEYDAFEDRYTLHCGNQFPHDLRDWIANSVLHISPMQLRVVSPDMGGAFGLRSHIFAEIAMTLWAAKKLRRPVKWRGDRSEGLMEDHGRDVVLNGTLGLDAEGKFTALKVEGIANMGAYLSNFGPLPAFGNLSGIAGPYTTPAIAAKVTSVFTNTAAVHPYRGAGRPEATLLIEQAIDKAARELDIDRVELRRRNLIAPDAMPYQTPLSYCYDCGEFERNMDAALERCDYAGFAARRQVSEANGKLRGLGVINAIEQAAGMFDEGADLRFDASGMVTLSLGVHSHGQGHATVFRQVVASELGIDPARIRYVHGDTDLVSYGHGTGGSRASGLASAALVGACAKIVEKGKAISAHLLECAAEDVEFERGTFRIVGTDKTLSLDDVARQAHTVRGLPSGMDSGLKAFATFTPSGPTFPNATHCCEVEIDPLTGETSLLGYWAVEDVGTVMNPMLLKGQLHGGIVQGLGQVFLEQVVYEADGQLLSGSFMDYAMPRAIDVIDTNVESMPVPTKVNPLGVKGVGEAGTVGALAAAMSAVQDALATRGVNDFEMPATPHRVWQALRH